MHKIEKKSAIIFIFFFILVLPACKSSLAQEPTPVTQPTVLPTSLPASSELQGITWLLESMGDVQPVEGSHITIRFDGDAMEGSTGCRGYRGAYQVYENSITFVTFNVLGEEDTCQDEKLRSQETLFTGYLKLCTTFEVDEDKLELYTVDGQILLFIPELPGE